MKILIADDDFMSRNLLLEVLKDYGTIHIAADGKQPSLEPEGNQLKRNMFDL